MTPTKKYLYIAAAVLLFLGILGWFFYSRGKKQVTLQDLPGELPGNPNSGNITGASNDEIKNIANQLFADMDGLNVMGHNYDGYNDAVLLNDKDLVKLYNTFNSLYQKKTGETLTAWLSGEQFYYPEAPGILLTRLKKLNCL